MPPALASTLILILHLTIGGDVKDFDHFGEYTTTTTITATARDGTESEITKNINSTTTTTAVVTGQHEDACTAANYYYPRGKTEGVRPTPEGLANYVFATSIGALADVYSMHDHIYSGLCRCAHQEILALYSPVQLPRCEQTPFKTLLILGLWSVLLLTALHTLLAKGNEQAWTTDALSAGDCTAGRQRAAEYDETDRDTAWLQVPQLHRWDSRRYRKAWRVRWIRRAHSKFQQRRESV